MSFHQNITNLIDLSLLKAVSFYAGVAPTDASYGARGSSIRYKIKDACDLLASGKKPRCSGHWSYDFNSKTLTIGLSVDCLKDNFEFFSYLHFVNINN